MTTANDIPDLSTFAYTAQTFGGQQISGTIDATSLADASRRLETLRLRVMRLDAAEKGPRPARLSGEDFAAFNQQLANLSAAGLPIEQGLRLIAEDLNRGGLAESVRNVAGELDRGSSLAEAFKKHEKQFPPLYATLVDAGVRSGNLPAVLLNLGRHIELVSRMRATLWQAAAYPLMVIAGLLVVIIFLGYFVMPKMEEIFSSFGTQLPQITVLLLSLARIAPALVVLGIALLAGMPLIWALLRAMHLDRAAADLALPLPLIGPILRRNLIARWCDALRLAVRAGMDLPAAVSLACDVVGSPALARDGARIAAHLSSGQRLDQVDRRMRIIPAPLLAVVQYSADRGDLAVSLETMAMMWQQQAEIRLNRVQVTLTPILVVSVGVFVGFVVVGMFAPLITLVQSVSSP